LASLFAVDYQAEYAIHTELLAVRDTIGKIHPGDIEAVAKNVLLEAKR
jgi:hypothetical protein